MRFVDSLKVSEEPRYLYGLSLAEYQATRYTVAKDEAFGSVMDGLGIPYRRVMKLLDISKGMFNDRRWRFGDRYWVFRKLDTSSIADYFVYEATPTEYVIFHLQDSLSVKKITRPTHVSERSVSGVIESSLYETLSGKNVSPAIAVGLSEVYAWTIDFFRIQKGDRFEVIFEERYVDDTLFVGTGRILGAVTMVTAVADVKFSDIKLRSVGRVPILAHYWIFRAMRWWIRAYNTYNVPNTQYLTTNIATKIGRCIR